MEFAFDCRHERERITRLYPHQEHVAAVRHLVGGESHLRPVILLYVIFAGRFVARARNHAHNRHWRRILYVGSVVIDLLANRIFAGKIFLRERFVDDDHSRAVCAIIRGDGASAQQRHSHHTKIIGRYVVYFRLWSFARRIRRRAGEMKRTVPFVVIKGNVRA